MSSLPLKDITHRKQNNTGSALASPLAFFTPKTRELMSKLNLVPPSSPLSPDILSGRGYSEKELSVIASLEEDERQQLAQESSAIREAMSSPPVATVAAADVVPKAAVAACAGATAAACTTASTSKALPFEVLEQFILHENTLRFIPVASIGTMHSVSSRFNKVMGDSEKVWYIACCTLASEKCLYLPYPQVGNQQGSWKRIFFEQLFPARNKWQTSALTDQSKASQASTDFSDFKIIVASR